MDELYLMSPLEIAWGYLPGHDGSLPAPTNNILGPRRALEEVIRRSLQRPPCGVAFSGGRDSSLVLAVATHVARRDGLPLPIPITRDFPEVSESQEHEWQQLVVRHLGLDDWHRVSYSDELELIGPLATPTLIEHGVIWPPSFAGDLPLVDAVTGGSVLDGEGGDEVLGVAAHRIAGLTRLLRRPLPFRWRKVRSALGALAPAAVRGRHERRQVDGAGVTWLRPAALEPLISALEQVERDRPLSFAASVRMVPRRRTQVLGARNRQILAREKDVEFTSPLLDPDFVHALSRDGGLIGRVDRTDALRALASDLLPDSVISRATKARFNRCYMGVRTRQFAAAWDDRGVDADLVDVDELRRMWLSDRPPAPTWALLQAAWLAGHGHAPSTFDQEHHSGVANDHCA